MRGFANPPLFFVGRVFMPNKGVHTKEPPLFSWRASLLHLHKGDPGLAKDLRPCGKHQTKKQNFLVCQQGPVRAGNEASGPMASIIGP